MMLIMDFFHFVLYQAKHNKILNYSAQMAYNVLLAFIPLMMLIHNFFNWISVDWGQQVSDKIKDLMPSFMAPLLESADMNYAGPQTSFWANFIFAIFVLYFSTIALRSFAITITKVMNIKETRNYFKLWGVGLISLVILVVFLFFFLAFYLITQQFSIRLFGLLGISQLSIRYWQIASMLLIAAYLSILLTFAYMHAPPQRLSLKQSLPGSIFVSTGWLCVSLIYRYVISNYLNLKSITLIFVGPFSFIIVIYCICLVLVLGATLNLYVYQKEGIHHEE